MIVVIRGGGVNFRFEVATLEAQDNSEVELGIPGPANVRNFVQPPNLMLDPIQLFGGDEIGLVEHDEIREGDLLARFGGFLQLAGYVLGIHDGDHAVQGELAADALVGV